MTPRENQTAAILDMWYGHRRVWYDPELPPEMNVIGANPAYMNHCELDYVEEFGLRHNHQSWIDGVREGIALGMYENRDE